MPVTIKRNTGPWAYFIPMAIKINDKKVGKIKSDEQIEVKLPDKTAQLKVVKFPSRSNRIEVTDGDIIEIRASRWHNLIFWGFLITLYMSYFITNITYRAVIATFIIVLAFVTAFCLNEFYLKKNED
ncbi:hypothetical protein M3N64_13515 [Sporolactobacillus sp. CPB3-1]|uniref:Signal peptidase I n=1 Tax=Sporolactobacillus mangiferae TaxID=2940498 RepID=A0ABT0MDJ4_9BACL|nr:hypothetical protein [Sporolactobacillus mangiferae]MCL1632939.1 hypothetical protein [Sporolactobacillus mangiferae]